jgi:hypothetical protein
VVQGCDLLSPHVGPVAAAIDGWLATLPFPPEVVVLETGRCRGDADFADRLERALAPRRVWRLPGSRTVEDLAAAMAGGGLFLGSSLHGAITALVYRRPFVLLKLFDEPKLDGFADLTGLGRFVVGDAARIPAALETAAADVVPPAVLRGLQDRVDRHFDRLAELAVERTAARPHVAGTSHLLRPGRRLHGWLRRGPPG